jgi:hypothetical protein
MRMRAPSAGCARTQGREACVRSARTSQRHTVQRRPCMQAALPHGSRVRKMMPAPRDGAACTPRADSARPHHFHEALPVQAHNVRHVLGRGALRDGALSATHSSRAGWQWRMNL